MARSRGKTTTVIHNPVSDVVRDDAPIQELVSQVGPVLNLPPGQIDFSLNVDHVAQVVCTNLKRKLKAALEEKLAEARALDAQIANVNATYDALRQAEQKRLEATYASHSAYQLAWTLAKALGDFTGRPTEVTCEVGYRGNQGKGEQAFGIDFCVKYGRNKDYAGEQLIHGVAHYAPATAVMLDSLGRLEDLRTEKAAITAAATQISSQLNRPDLMDECRTLVIENTMQHNGDTARLLDSLYGKIGLVVDSRPVREQLQLVG